MERLLTKDKLPGAHGMGANSSTETRGLIPMVVRKEKRGAPLSMERTKGDG